MLHKGSMLVSTRAKYNASFRKKETNQTKTAALLSFVTIVLLLIVALSTHVLDLGTSVVGDGNISRLLDDNGDYSQYTCDDIFLNTDPNSAGRCLYAQTCNSNQGLFAAFVFCQTWNLSLSTWCSVLTPFLTIWLVLLFRMLGSTAEDFFSPSLEMFSMKMGLPPRFAGVTLLALGNGAADVSATISAIAQNPQEGYQMSLGALTGAGMFVGTVVAGVVIVIADGVKCRGALVRDLFMFIVTLISVYVFFDRGEIGVAAINCFFWLYLSFVMVVLVADIYHRTMVLPRIRQEESEERLAAETHSTVTTNNMLTVQEQGACNDEFRLNNSTKIPSPTSGIELASARTGSTPFHTPLSSMEENEGFEDNDAPTSPLQPGIDNDTSSKSSKRKGVRKMVRRGIDRVMVAISNYGPEEGKSNINQSYYGWTGGLEVNSEKNDEHVKLHGTTGILAKRGSMDDTNEVEEAAEPDFGPATSYRAIMEGVDNMCTINGSLSSGMGTSWGQAYAVSKEELMNHFAEYNRDIWENEENNAFDKFFLAFELPFTALRKLSVPIPCDDYYCRGLVATAVACIPLWIGVYAKIQHDSNLFVFGGFPYVEIYTFFSAIIALLIMKFAPAEEADMSLKVSVPIAFIGFIIAATWIDIIADQLVKLLTFLGVICRIPGSIMGLTVLAWGNSMGDMSANMTMAKKGLANMAITACFAGPVFNILIGLGGGFTKLNAATGQESTEVELTPSITVGLCFLAANCILVLVAGIFVNRGHIPKGYGYIALALYIVYVCTSVSMQIYHPE